MDKIRKVLLWVKTHSLWFLGIAAALFAVAFLGKRSVPKLVAQPQKTSGTIIEEQAKAADKLNDKIDDLNAEPEPAAPVADKSMEDLLSEYEKL